MNIENLPDPQPEEEDAVLTHLRALQQDCGRDLIALIHACIKEGIAIEERIVRVIVRLDFHPGHVRLVLRSRGARWTRLPDETYSNLN